MGAPRIVRKLETVSSVARVFERRFKARAYSIAVQAGDYVEYTQDTVGLYRKGGALVGIASRERPWFAPARKKRSPRCVAIEFDGAEVRVQTGGKPLTPESLEAIREIVRAGKKYLAELEPARKARRRNGRALTMQKECDHKFIDSTKPFEELAEAVRALRTEYEADEDDGMEERWLKLLDAVFDAIPTTAAGSAGAAEKQERNDA